MKAIVRTDEFKRAMGIVLPCVSKDDLRPLLNHIQGRVQGNKLILLGCDGFRAAEYRIDAMDAEDGFFWINPRVKMFLPCESITIYTDEKLTHIDGGLCGYQFRNIDSEQLKIDVLFNEDRGPQKNIALNSSFLAEAMRPLKTTFHNAVIFHIGNPDKAVALSLWGDENYRGLILPVVEMKSHETS